MQKPLVIIESPFRGEKDHDLFRNIRYLRMAVRDSIMRGEAPFASHGLYTQDGVLADTDPGERALGMACGWEWMRVADKVVVYQDLGISDGMKHGIDQAKRLGKPIEYRTILIRS